MINWVNHSITIFVFLAKMICSIACAANDSKWQMAFEPHIKVFSCSAAWWMISLSDSCFIPYILMKFCSSSFRMVCPSMQFTSRSQNLSLIRLSWAGFCSLNIICMISLISLLYGASIPSGFLVYLEAWSWIKAARRFLSQFLAMLLQVSAFNETPPMASLSTLPTYASTYTISACSGAGILKLRHLDLMGAMSLCTLLQISIILQFFMYFSMVLLRPPCASLVSLSAQLMMRILKPLPLLDSMLVLEAISFTTF